MEKTKNESLPDKGSHTKWIVLLIVFVLLFITGFTTSYLVVKYYIQKTSATTNQIQKSETSNMDNSIFISDISNSPFLTLGGYAPKEGEADYHGGQFVRAVVYPEDATNKEVDWSIAWADSDTQFGDNNPASFVSIYYDVEHGGSLCEVVCDAQFMYHDIVLTCTTRDGGCTATCNLSFIGIPDSICLVGSEIEDTPQVDVCYGNATHPCYALEVNSSMEFDIELDNKWANVGAEFNDFYLLVNGHGVLKVDEACDGVVSDKYCTRTLTSTLVTDDESGDSYYLIYLRADTIDSAYFKPGRGSIASKSNFPIAKVYINGSNVKVQALNNILSYYINLEKCEISGGYVHDYLVKPSSDAEDFGFTVVFKERNSGLDTSLNFVIQKGAVLTEHIELDENNIKF